MCGFDKRDHTSSFRMFTSELHSCQCHDVSTNFTAWITTVINALNKSSSIVGLRFAGIFISGGNRLIDFDGRRFSCLLAVNHCEFLQ